MNNNRFMLGLAGFISGVLSLTFSWLLFNVGFLLDSSKSDLHFVYYAYGESLWQFLPGVFFGLIIGTYMSHHFKVSKINIFFWTLTSIFAYIAAFIATAVGGFGGVSPFLTELIREPISLFVGSSIGSLIVVLGFNSFIFKLTGKQKSFLVLVGGLLGLINAWMSLLELNMFFTSTGKPSLFLLITWPTVIAFFLGYFLDKNSSVE